LLVGDVDDSGYTCDDFQKLPVNERNPEDLLFLEMAQKEKWRRCPKCSAMVELKVISRSRGERADEA
jgi:hypothetical protein